MKAKLLTLLILLVLIGGYSQGLLTIEKEQESILSSGEINTGPRREIEGQLITTPDLESQRLQTIQEQTQSIQGEVYNLTNKNIKAELIKQAQEGTRIQMIIEDRQYKGYNNTVEALQSEFKEYPYIQFKSDKELGTQFVHAKFWTTDNSSIIQTANLTFGGLNESKEHQFISQDEVLREQLNLLWDHDRNKGTKEEVPFPQLIPNLFVCPENCRLKIEGLLDQAQKSITIRNQYIMDQRILNLLKKKQKEGIEIRLLVSSSNSNYKLLEYFDDTRARMVQSPYMHTKTLTVDDQYFLISSINFSTNSMDNNREVGVLITDQDIIKQRTKDFNYFREQGKNE